ncbi:MAG: hypothetical protein AAFQ51_18065, partial [Pseudomonadota bacterium]
ARAMYGDPVMLVLDEPNSNLDAEGSAALNKAIDQMKAEGKTVIIMAHRPAAIASCDLLLLLDGGQVKAFGPRDEVLKENLKNYSQVAPSLGGGSGAPQVGKPQPGPVPGATVQPVRARPAPQKVAGAPQSQPTRSQPAAANPAGPGSPQPTNPEKQS